MPPEVMEAPAPAPAMVLARVAPYKSLLRMVLMPNLEAKVILAGVIWFILRILQSILGPRRRHSRHWFVQYGAMAAYYLPTLIAFYAANAVFSSDSHFKIPLSVGCLAVLFSCARGSFTMTALTLRNSGPLRVQYYWRVLPWLLYFASLQWSTIVWFDNKLNLSGFYSYMVLCIGLVLQVLVFKPQAATLDYETKLFADFMASPPSPLFHDDASSLYEGCKYPVKRDGDWISFSDVLRYYPGGDPEADICLSFIFSRLLARRYFGFPCAEDGNPQVRDLILAELLVGDNYKRLFALVEVQLALLHDYFFTNFHSDLMMGVTSLKQAMVAMLRLTWILVALYVVGLVIAALGPVFIGGYRGSLSAIVFLSATGVLSAVMWLVIFSPRHPFLPRYWHPIRNLFLHFSNPTDGASVAPPPPFDQIPPRYCWREKLGQYSVMEDYDRRSFKKTVLAWCKVQLYPGSYSLIERHNPSEEEEDVSVPEGLRKFLADTIRDIYGPPNDVVLGTRSPGVDDEHSRALLGDLSWTFEQGTLTHTILIWHIATCYCHMSPEAVAVVAKENHEIATTLSEYCAYLVAFLPELLPDHALTAKITLQQVLQKARDVLLLGEEETRMSTEAKRAKAQGHGLLNEPLSSLKTFQKGVRLGQQLEQQAGSSFHWKTMAVFWAEMILYIAAASSSDKSIAAAHIEQLAQGGEFVTHLWALLCNAGIVVKPGITQFPFSAMLTSRYREV